MNSSYRHIFRAKSLFGGVRAVNYLVNLVRTKLVAVLLGTAGVGLNSVYDSVRDLLHCATNLGLEAIGTKNISQKYEELLAESGREERDRIQMSLNRDVCALRSWIAVLSVVGVALTILLAVPLSLLTFQDTEHIKAFIFISPSVGLSTFICGEAAILQGMRKLKSVAAVSVITTIATTLVATPIYYFLHIDGVIPAFIGIYAASAIVVISFSYRLFPPHYDFSKETLGVWLPLLKVGIAIVVVNFTSSIIEVLTKSFLNATGSLDTVGLYNTNTTITRCFSAFFIASIASDYFPRLSGVFHNKSDRAVTVRKQSEFLLLVAPPAIVLFIFAIPIIVPLLLSSEFTRVIPLTRLAMVSLIFRFAHLPYTYTPLAAGDSKTYLTLGIVQSIDLLLIIPGYWLWGLTGIGIMLVAVNIIDFLMALYISGRRYGVSMSCRNVILLTAQTVLTVSAYFCASLLTGGPYIVSSVIIAVASVFFSYLYYRNG